MTLLEYFKLFDYKPKECPHKTCFSLKNKFGFLHRRRYPKIVKIISIKCHYNLSKERYMHQLLILFLPWKSEVELKNGFDMYAIKYRAKRIF